MIEIVPMEEKHIDGVLAVEEATFSIPWTREDFEKEVKNAIAIYYVAVLDEKIVGYAGMWHIVTEGHITNVGVLEEARGHGIGAKLMEKLIAEAEEKEMTGITLEVRMGMHLHRGCIINTALRLRGSVKIIIPIPRKMP